MRGTLPLIFDGTVIFRITPAYAGNTPMCNGKISLFQDHPRLCGEHIMTSVFDAFPSGSPPPMRGTPLDGVPVSLDQGITPAYAGNTCKRPGPAYK